MGSTVCIVKFFTYKYELFYLDLRHFTAMAVTVVDVI